MVQKNWCLEKLAEVTLYFDMINLKEVNTSKALNFFILKIKNYKTYIFNQYTNSLKKRGVKLLITDQNSLIKSYTVKLSNDLKFLTRFLNDTSKGFMDEYANEFDRKNIIFFRDPNRKLGCIPFKFHLTKEYINQFL